MRRSAEQQFIAYDLIRFAMIAGQQTHNGYNCTNMYPPERLDSYSYNKWIVNDN